MKLAGIFRFELALQLRRPWPWLCMVVLAVFAFLTTRVSIVPATLPKDFILNSPFIIAAVTVFSCQIWLLIAAGVAGEAGARDVHTGLHPLVYASPVSKMQYLGGRFLAALSINALILLAVQLGSLVAAYAPGVDPQIIGPFRPAAYGAAYGFIAITTAFIATTVQFSAALLSGRPMASYVGSMGLFFLSYPVTFALYMAGLGERALIVDPVGVFSIMNEMMLKWTIVEKNVRMFVPEGRMLLNRLVWLGIAFATLAATYRRFRFAHRVAWDPWALLTRRSRKAPPQDVDPGRLPAAVAVPHVDQSFGFRVHVRQALSIARSSLWMLVKNPAGIFLLAVFPAFVVLVLFSNSEHWGVPLLLRTGNILNDITSPLTQVVDFRVMVPLLIIYFAGELIWRERDAQLSDTIDSTSVPEWVLYTGKFLGLAFMLAAFMLAMTAAGMLAQVITGYYNFEIGLYLKVLFGLQLPEYLLFAALAFLVHTITLDKYAGLLVALVVFMLMIFAPRLGIEHHLLIYSASPEWSYTDIRGFGSSLEPWLWFKLYWAAWALLLAVAARLLWVRGRESRFRTRIQIARRRLTRTTVRIGALAITLILVLGGFIFYNTNVLNEYHSSEEVTERAAEYERRYARYNGIPQPRREATKLHIEIYPDRGAATMRGSYLLVNRDTVPIDSVHIETLDGADTDIRFDRAATVTLQDDELRHTIYALNEPLQPGDSLTLQFAIEVEPRGFRHGGATTPIIPNGTHFNGGALPRIGYQPGRELISSADRRKHGLPRKVTFPTPEDVAPEVALGSGATFDAVMVTDEDQVAIAPGVLRRTWVDNGRRHFHYTSDVPIGGQFMFFSADYELHREQRNGVEIQIYTDPRHIHLRERLLRSVRASLDYFSTEFGAYPYPFLQIIEQPAKGMGMGVDGSGVVTGLEGFFRLSPQDDDFDSVFQITAHEMAHQWWGVQLKHAFAEGAIVLSESLAWYSAMQVMKHTNGKDQLQTFMSHMREPMPWPPIRTGLPLLRAMDPWAGYRKGPYALYALSEYMGEHRVNGALASLLRNQTGKEATTLDLYRELHAVTPDSFKYLLHDLFVTNTFWELDAKETTARQTVDGPWQVTLKVRARKVVADTAGAETEMAMNEWVPIGVFANAEGRGELSAPLYLKMHRIRSGEQTITVTVPRRPALAGIDPHHLLDWVEKGNDDNIEVVKITS